MSAIDGVNKISQILPGMGEAGQPAPGERPRPPARNTAGQAAGVSDAPAPAATAAAARALQPDKTGEAGLKAAAYRGNREESRDESEAERLDEAVAVANLGLEMEKRSMRFRISDVSDELQIQIVDTNRDKVIRSIPSDEMIKLAGKLRDLFGVGAMVDESR